MFPLLSTRSNPLGLCLVCGRASAYPNKTQSERAIKGMPKRMTFPPGGRFESTRPKLAIATISIGMPTALWAVSLFSFEVIHANAGPKTMFRFLLRTLTFAEKLELPTVNAASDSGRRVNTVTRRCQGKTKRSEKQERAHIRKRAGNW